MQSCSQKASTRVEILPADQGFEKRKGKCFKCKKLGHWARDCPENKSEEFAAILVADQQRSPKNGSKKTDDSFISELNMIDPNSKENFFDGMVICSEDQQCLQAENLDVMTSRKQEKLQINTGSEVKSYRVPKTAGK